MKLMKMSKMQMKVLKDQNIEIHAHAHTVEVQMSMESAELWDILA